MQTSTSTTNVNPHFDQLASGLRTAMTEFEKTASPQNVDSIFEMFKPVAEMGQRAWNETVDYSRRHPIRIAVTVCALGLLAAKVMQPKVKGA